jgi:two-component system, LytTR family, sensor kinase
MFKAMSLRARKWAWICAVWGTLGIMDAVQTIFSMHAQGMQHAWLKLLFTLSVSWAPWAAATPLILYLGRRFRPISVLPLSTWAVHLAMVMALTAVTATWHTALEQALHPWAPMEVQLSFQQSLVLTLQGGMVYALVVYALTLTAGYMLDSRLRLAQQVADAARLNEQLSNARLDALRHQIEPHFIFNSLNATAGLVREGRNDDAVRMIVGLSEFLRRVAREFQDHQVTLAQEMEFLEKYLEIQKVRFTDRLGVTLQVPADLRDAQVPTLLLQPIVENALKHGIAKRVQGGAIRVAAATSNGRLRIDIYNDGPLLDPNWEAAGHGDGNSSGIGLANLRTRLRLLYGDEFELRMANVAAAGVQVSVSVPYRKAG